LLIIAPPQKRIKLWSERATGKEENMNHTVLLVDDESNVLDGLARTLRKEPYQIVTATTAAEAIEILQSTSIDVIVCDEQMPKVSGTELLAAIADTHPQVVRIMLTGHASPSLWQRAIREGAIYRFLCKPCSEIELTLAIRQALKQQLVMPH
jgi:DNA-binding NtrC family response regulator